MGLRFPIVAALAALVTFGLFWVMHVLVNVPYELGKGGAPPSIEFVRLKRDTTPETKKREPPKREKPEQAPPPPEMNMAKAMKPGDAVGDIVPIVDTGAELERATALGAGGSDSDVVPLVRVDPDYPPRARQQGIEGWVDIEFTISAVGTVQDPRVIGSSPPYVFDRSALKAVRRWRYNPKLEHGVAVARAGVQVRLRFQIDSSGR